MVTVSAAGGVRAVGVGAVALGCWGYAWFRDGVGLTCVGLGIGDSSWGIYRRLGVGRRFLLTYSLSYVPLNSHLLVNLIYMFYMLI